MHGTASFTAQLTADAPSLPPSLPPSLLQVRGYRSLLREKRVELGDKASKLEGGLTKLDETTVQVGGWVCRSYVQFLAG